MPVYRLQLSNFDVLMHISPTCELRDLTLIIDHNILISELKKFHVHVRAVRKDICFSGHDQLELIELHQNGNI